MTATPRWGITLPLRGLPVPEQRDIVAALPDLGYTDAWSSELNGADAFTPLALVAQWTDRLRLGTAIAGIFTRGPALLAMNAATMAALAPGRFVLGIGTSSPVIVEAWNGIELARPVGRAGRARRRRAGLRADRPGVRLPDGGRTRRPGGRPPADRRLPHRARLRRLPRLAGPRRGAAPHAGRVGGRGSQGRARRHPRPRRGRAARARPAGRLPGTGRAVPGQRPGHPGRDGGARPRGGRGRCRPPARPGRLTHPGRGRENQSARRGRSRRAAA